MAKRKTSAGKTTTKKTLSKKREVPETGENKFLIVGMGASAGGLEALKQFFSSMPNEPGMAFVLVQHLDPHHKSLMAQLLGKHTEMKVAEVEDNTEVRPHHVYIIPPNKDMAIFNGILHLMDPTCLLYTSDAADDLLCVDLGGRRIIKK